MNSPIKWAGGKHYLASRIVALMPPRKTVDRPDGYLHFVEPYAGSLAVLLANDPKGISEVANDLNASLGNFWHVLRHPDLFPLFLRRVQATPFSEDHWEAAEYAVKIQEEQAKNPAWITDDNQAWWATDFFILCRQSLAGRMKDFAPLSRNRVRRGMNEQASAWLSAVEGLPEVHERLKRVVILNHDALDVIREQDGPHTLFYLDSPYLHETRADTKTYAHEMTVAQHFELLNTILECKGFVMLSGYHSAMYDEALKHWRREEFDLPNNAAGGEEKRRMTECLWLNYNAEGKKL